MSKNFELSFFVKWDLLSDYVVKTIFKRQKYLDRLDWYLKATFWLDWYHFCIVYKQLNIQTNQYAHIPFIFSIFKLIVEAIRQTLRRENPQLKNITVTESKDRVWSHRCDKLSFELDHVTWLIQIAQIKHNYTLPIWKTTSNVILLKLIFDYNHFSRVY